MLVMIVTKVGDISGHPALIGRHRPFPVTHRAAERWLHHMQLALDETPEIDADSKVRMTNFFKHVLFSWSFYLHSLTFSNLQHFAFIYIYIVIRNHAFIEKKLDV